MPGTTWTRWCSCRWMAVVVYSEGVVWTSYSLVRKNDINIITSRYRWSERLVAGDFGDRDICTISETGQKVQPQKSVSFKLYLFQDAEILLSIIASTLKGKVGSVVTYQPPLLLHTSTDESVTFTHSITHTRTVCAPLHNGLISCLLSKNDKYL